MYDSRHSLRYCARRCLCDTLDTDLALHLCYVLDSSALFDSYERSLIVKTVLQLKSEASFLRDFDRL